MAMSWLLLSVWVCVSVGGGLASVKQTALDAHNNARRTEAKAERGADLYEYVWDDALAHTASTWAAKCDYNHQHIHGMGENLYYGSPIRHTDDYYMQHAVDRWMGEKRFNENGHFDCCFGSNHTCCHYTQVVSSRSRTIGCAVHHCNPLKDGSDVQSAHAAFVVCDYEPSGNIVINGHRMAGYTHGATCSQCDAGDTCSDGLCTSSDPAVGK